ncbi:MAG: hypothetical protein AB8B80_11740 [Marinicellaceae bacterium]
MKIYIMAIGLLLSYVSFAGNLPITVGTDQACDYDNIEDALGSGNFLDIHVTNQKTYRENLLIGDIFVNFKGGFNNCEEAALNIPSSIKTKLSGDLDDDGTGDGTVLQIMGSGNISMSGFKVYEGYFSNKSGGISIDSYTGIFTLENSIISDNYGTLGGGIGIHDSPDAEIFIGSSVLIINNSAILAGGGLFCNDNTTIDMPESAIDSGISNNSSNFNGGGVFLSNECVMTFRTGRVDVGLLDFRGIAGNKANNNGGGIYLTSGATIYLLPTSGNTVNISENIADFDNSGQGNGGGAYISGSSSYLGVLNSRFVSNTAIDGGAAYVQDQGTVSVLSNGVGCAEFNKCAVIKSNTASSQGGAIYAKNDTTINLVRALVEFNRADVANVLFLEEAAQANIHYSVFTRNGNNGNDGFADLGLFHLHTDAHISMVQSTVVDNYAETGVFLTDITPFSLSVFNSIVHDPSTGLAVDLSQQQEDNLSVFCSIFHEDSGLYGDDVVVDDPEFIDRIGRDFNLDHTTSIAIDACFQLSNYDHDYSGAVAGFDDPSVIGSGGTFDTGAFESYGTDIIFEHSF